MNNILPVKEIRKLIGSGQLPVEERPGVYTWWFKESEAESIMRKLGLLNFMDRLMVRKINGENYYALYFGIAGGKSGLLGRIKWHVCQKHTASTVKSGYLSTLRKTICAINGCDMTKGESITNEVMDRNCYWEWWYTKNEEDAETIEKQELCTHYYPLNIKDNKLVDKDTINLLKKLRTKYKK